MTDANGIVTDYSYHDAGCVTRIVRRDGSEVLSSLDVASSKGTTYFNDMLGTTVGTKSGATYSAAALSAFGEDLNHHSPTPTSNSHSFYTGKPEVAGLGYAFLMRNYRAGLAKWQTADPMGYPENAPQKLCLGGKARAQRSARRARKGPRCDCAQGSFPQELANRLTAPVVACDTKVEYVHVKDSVTGEETVVVKAVLNNPLDQSVHWIRFNPE